MTIFPLRDVKDLLFFAGALAKLYMVQSILIIEVLTSVHQPIRRLKFSCDLETNQSFLLSLQTVRSLRLGQFSNRRIFDTFRMSLQPSVQKQSRHNTHETIFSG